MKADKGFVLTVEGGAPEILAARNFQRQDIEDAVERLSDSIVRRALDTKQPVIVSDAVHDAQFNASASVVNLKLASVMCVPLLLRARCPAPSTWETIAWRASSPAASCSS